MDKIIFKDISYGMYIVTTKDNNKKDVGCIINTLTQITSNNPIISISLNKDNYTNSAIKDNKLFSISILSIDTKKELIGTFGYHSSKNIDKFKDINYETINNLPIIKENTTGYLIVELINIIDCNTHDIFIAKVLDTKKISNIEPMTYKYYQENLKGTSPKNAPTFIEEPKEESTSNKYQCSLCGYIYDDAKEEIKFEDLPDNWVCPLCGASKSLFNKIN